MRSQPKLTVLITAIGVSLFLEYGGQFVFGADPKGFPDLVVDRAIEGTGALTITTAQLAAFLISIVLLIGLTLIVKRTKLGMAMRAVSNNATAAMLMGVNIDTVISFTFGLGSALAGAAGILYAITYPSIDPLMGILPGIKAFVAAVLGGIGNIPGAAVGGILLGIVETFVGGSQLFFLPRCDRFRGADHHSALPAGRSFRKNAGGKSLNAASHETSPRQATRPDRRDPAQRAGFGLFGSDQLLLLAGNHFCRDQHHSRRQSQFDQWLHGPVLVRPRRVHGDRRLRFGLSFHRTKRRRF